MSDSRTTRTSEPASIAGPGRSDQPLLVAVEGRNGTAALRAAELIAARSHSKVVVLSVLEPESTAAYDPQFGFLSPEYEAARVANRHADVRQQIDGATGAGADWPVDVRFGPAAATIAEEARRRGASLVVMDVGRHGPLARLAASETALRTMRRSTTPVLAVSGEFRKLPSTAIAAIDFSPSSIAAARTALDVIAGDAVLYLVHVWSRSGSDHPSERARDQAHEHALSGLFDRVEEILRAPHGITVRRITLLGNPVEELLELARSQGADLIAAGRRGHGLFERLLVGSTTTALVRSVGCSILVTPEPTTAETDALARAITGGFASRSPDEWAVVLDGFSRRNRGRRVVLEVDDPHVGTQMQATGYALVGVSYDHNGRSAQIMLADPLHETAHLTHTIPNVTAVALRSRPTGKDDALRVDHREGAVLLRMLDPDHSHDQPSVR